MSDKNTRLNQSAIALATLIEQTARGIYDQRGPAHLHPVQWAALRFFRRANRRARSVAGLANYLGVTLGPASRTVAALKKHGLVETTKDSKDARVSIISLTAEGKEALAADPIGRLAMALQDLKPGDFDALAGTMTQVNAHLGAQQTAVADGG